MTVRTKGKHGGARTPGPNAPGGTGHRANSRPKPDQPGAWMPHCPWPEHTRPRRNLPGLDFYERGEYGRGH